MNSTNSLLELKNISKTYYNSTKETKVLDNINFKLYENDFLGIIGPSGCGKSTLLNIISLLDKEYTGKYKIKDNIKIGYMFQEDALFNWLNIYDNCILGLKITKSINEKNIEYINNLLKKYNLYEYKDKYPFELSGGMKQRVALIRTLALKPDILLLDEAFSALDYQTKIKVSQDVYNIIKNENKTAILVTHDIEEAIRLCNRIIVLSKIPSKVKNTYEINKEINYLKTIWEDIDE